jgi:dihydroneopterin aldolase
MDKVYIKDLNVIGILGIHPHEQRTPQQIRISAEVSTDIRDAAQNDAIDQTVNYSSLADNIRQFVAESHFKTIEALIESLAELILNNPLVFQVKLWVEKPNAVPDAASVGIEITRTQQD